MRKFGLIQIGALIGVLALVLAFLYAKTRSYDAAAYFENEALLRQLRQVDAQWELDGLRSKIGVNTNYDPLTDPLLTLERLQREFDEKGAEAGAGADSGASKARDALHQTIAQKTDLVEQFKSHNSILRNSLAFISIAADDVQRRVSDALASRRGDSAALATVALETNRVLLDLLKYNLSAADDRAAAIRADLERIDERGRGLPREVAASVEIFLAHAHTILREHKTVGDLLNAISAVPAGARIDDLSDRLNKWQQEATAQAQEYRSYLLGFSAVLIVLIIYFAYRLIGSYAEIARVNDELKQTNEGLEEKVTARTAELSKALDDLKESEAQLIQNEKMSSLGQMVAGVAHEINTPLGYVKGNLEIVDSRMEQIERVEGLCSDVAHMLSTEGAKAADFRERMQTVFDAANAIRKLGLAKELKDLVKDGVYGLGQIDEIVANLRSFSRLDRAANTKFDLHEGINSTLMIAHNLLKDKAEVRREFGEIPRVLCSPSQINQVVLNLVTNAAQALDERGVITITTARHDEERVRIEVADTGHGIPADVLPKIFDPFFTTKDVGKGTGLGLAIVRKIIDQHGGTIDVRSEVGKGTCFTIVMPIGRAAVESREDVEFLEQQLQAA